jgi:hypothetical protein
VLHEKRKEGEQMSIATLTISRKGLYLVSRTSSCDSQKPCEEAYQVKIKSVDARNVDDPKKIPSNRGTNGDWYERGENHRVENGKIKRDMGWVDVWVVDIDDIAAFVDKYGDCIIGRDQNGFSTIEIYDDYRE